jgi:hypothetical protein
LGGIILLSITSGRCLLICAVLLALLATVASADSVSYSNSQTFLALDNWNYLYIPQFDPALGTLTGVNVTLEGEVLGDTTVTNNTGGDVAAGTNFGANFLLDATGYGNWLNFAYPQITFSDNLNTTDNTSATHSGLDLFDSASTSVSAGDASLYDWIGTGVDDLYLLPEDDTSFSPYGIDGSHDMSANSNLTVTYSYGPTPTPEPGSLALLGLGLPMAGMWLRRKRTA